ncbi:MAG: dTDP-glucose 4,6-dehydratase [Pseudomonadales bacterium]|nr:dTDP-glucose 4,6-dehydratase [Pseudomonadales bacterium]
MKLLITGGAGFIGSAAVRCAVALGHEVLNVDALTYAGDLATVSSVENSALYRFARLDITDLSSLRHAVRDFGPDAILHFAAETHVDRSIDDPTGFVQTNVVGTTNLLDAALHFYSEISGSKKANFRFISVSTDEVYGSLGSDGYFNETLPYDPSSPYSASKAAADHMCKAWYRTYGLPVIVTNCSNNFGPYQHPEKLIPTVVQAALEGSDIPVYGTGLNVRDWLYVDDHINAIFSILVHGQPGDTYCVGGNCEKTNLDIVSEICEILDRRFKKPSGDGFSSQIVMVQDRLGHDFRYAIDNSKLVELTGWKTSKTFLERLGETVDWFVDHRDWLSKHEGRLGLGNKNT